MPPTTTSPAFRHWLRLREKSLVAEFNALAAGQVERQSSAPSADEDDRANVLLELIAVVQGRLMEGV